MDEQVEQVLQTLVPGEGERLWYVFRSRPRREKMAAAQFTDMGMGHYLPVREQVSRRKGRRYRSLLPLFPGYLFGCCDVGERFRAMREGHLSQWLEVIDQETLLSELRSICIASMLSTGLKLYPQLQRGKWVRIVNGPLSGVRGRISRRKENYRIVLEMTALQAALAVEVDMQDVVIDDTVGLGSRFAEAG